MKFGGVCISECGTLAKSLIDLISDIYWCKQDPNDLTSDETDLLEASIEVLSSMLSHPSTHKYPTIVLQTLSLILESFTKILNAERIKKDSNKDVVCLIYGLVVTIADTHSKVLIRNLLSDRVDERELSVEVFKCVLGCSDLPGSYPVDENSSTCTFGFWYTLQVSKQAHNTLPFL